MLKYKRLSLLIPLSLALLASAQANAAILFSEDFNNVIGGVQNGGQYQSNLAVRFAASYSGWSIGGGNAAHVVDYANTFGSNANPSNFAVMFWQDNTITSNSIIGANTLGSQYAVDFSGSAAVYQASQQATAASDGLIIEILNANNTVIASNNFQSGAWTGTMSFTNSGFNYVGDGNGDVKIRVRTFGLTGRFGGAIDDITLSNAASVPVSGTLGLSLLGLMIVRLRGNRV